MWSQYISSFGAVVKIAIITGFVTSALGSPLQYCNVDASIRTDQCLAISTYHNKTSNASDFYLLISAKFEDRGGFAAFGTGQTMDGALMFVIYPGENVGDVTMSLRTTNYHYAPETSKLTPDYRVLNTWVEGDYHNAQLVCYSCDKWTRNSAKVTSQNQGWIFSNHYEYTMQSNDVSKPLTLHSDYALFELDMTISHYTDGLPTAPELVKNGRKSVGAQKAKASTQQLFAIHGLLLVFTFVILMPLGIAGIRSGHQNSFKIHWIVQICSTSIAVVTMGLSVCLSWEMIRVTTPRGAHKLIGLSILLCLGMTPCLGYLHHMRYLKFKRATGLTVWHRRLGASVLAGSWVNVFLGLFVASQPAWCFIAGFGLMTSSSFAIYLAPKLGAVLDSKTGMTMPKYRAVEDKDSEQELLKEGEEDESL